MTSTTIESVIVIGAGAAGLAMAHALREAGIAFRLLEKEERVAEPWRRRHPRLAMNTHSSLSALPGSRYPAGTGAFARRDAVVSHLEDYVEMNNLPVEYGVSVRDVTRDNGVFLLDTNIGALRARHVIVATGRDREPVMPAWPGVEDFKGEVIHAAAFADAAAYAGKRVLVVGAGNSGIDILNHLAAVKTQALWLSVRGGPSILPKRIGGVSVHRLSPWTARLPHRLADAVIAATQRLAFGDLTRFGLPAPKRGAASRLASEDIAIAADDGAIRAIRKGLILVVPQVRRFIGKGVELADGATLDPQVVIAATGYTPGLEPMLGRLGVLDDRGRPRFDGDAQSPDTPGLWFLGMRAALIGDVRNATISARRIARAIALSIQAS